MRRFLLALIFAAVAGLPALACDLLPESALRQVVPDAGAISQLSEIAERCRYQWAKPDQTSRRESNDEQLQESMRRGSESYQPLSLWNEVSVELFAQTETVSQAQSLFANYLRGQTPESFGSPDPLADTPLTRIEAPGDRQLAWNAQTRQLLLQAGTRLLLLEIQVEDDPKKNEAVALQLVDKLK